MTARQVWEGMLTELSKVNAPSMLLQDFNYFFNKAINQYINKRYNIYDISQQTTDDLRVLKATTVLEPELIANTISGVDTSDWKAGNASLFGATYEVYLPLDYLHMLNCICVYKLNKRFKCYNAGDYVQFAAKRLTADSWSVVVNDYYNRPLPERPYYYIHNVNTSIDLPTNPVEDISILNRTFKGTDAAKDYINSNSTTIYVRKYKESSEGEEKTVTNLEKQYELQTFKQAHPTWIITETAEVKNTNSNSIKIYVRKYKESQEGEEQEVTNLEDQYELQTFKEKHPTWIVTETAEVKNTTESQSNLPRTISLKNIQNKSTVEKESGVRYGNPSSVRCEIRYGKDHSVFELQSVVIDYIKAPQTIRLTQEQVDLTEDTSQIMEFPDYVCQEIINELTMLVMENTADPRLQTNTVVTQSIANPAQQQTPQPQPQPQQRG